VGPTFVAVAETAAYAALTTVRGGRDIRYAFDWDDGSGDTTNYYRSGETATASRAWDSVGTYAISVGAQSSTGEWTHERSDTLNVTVHSFQAPGR
jgi:hypothetical protein